MLRQQATGNSQQATVKMQEAAFRSNKNCITNE